MRKFSVSERFACRVLDQHRSTQRKKPRGRADEAALTADIIRLATQYGRYGYRRITAMLRSEGWSVNVKRVERIWRREGLKVPSKQTKKGRLWLNDGSCIRLRPERRNHVWSYDFVEAQTHDGRKFRMLIRLSTSSPANAWPSGLRAGSTASAYIDDCRICSSCAECLGTFVPTTSYVGNCSNATGNRSLVADLNQR